MVAFEIIDDYIMRKIEKLDQLLPKEISDKEVSFILYKKIHEYTNKRKYNQQIDFILNTDPELLEIDNLLKRIRK